MCRRGELPIEVDALHTHNVLGITIRVMFNLGGGWRHSRYRCGIGGVSITRHDGGGEKEAHTRRQRDDLPFLQEKVQPPEGNVQQKRILLEARHCLKPSTAALKRVVRTIDNRWHRTKRLRLHNAV